MRALCLVALAFAGTAMGQSSLQVSGVVALPQGSFSDAADESGAGLAAGFLAALPGAPVAIGLEGSIVVYGLESRNVPLSLTIPDVRVDVVTSNNLSQGLAVARLQRPRGAVRPYVDGVAGLTYLYTETSVVGATNGYGAPLSSTNYDDIAMTAGGGLGVLVPFHTRVSKEGTPTAIAVDARVRYLVGGEASYLARGGIDRHDDGTIRLAPHRSRTDLVAVHLGVSFLF